MFLRGVLYDKRLLKISPLELEDNPNCRDKMGGAQITRICGPILSLFLGGYN